MKSRGEIKYILTLDATFFLLSCPFICVLTFRIHGLNWYMRGTDFSETSRRNSWFCEHFAFGQSTAFILYNILLYAIVDIYHYNCPCVLNKRHLAIGNHNADFSFLAPIRHQAIIWTSAGILLIRPLGTHFSEISIGIQYFHSRKCIWKYCLRNGVHFVSASMC